LPGLPAWTEFLAARPWSVHDLAADDREPDTTA